MTLQTSTSNPDESTPETGLNTSGRGPSAGECPLCDGLLQKSSVQQFEGRDRRTYLCHTCYAGAVTCIELHGPPTERETTRCLANAQRLLDYGLTTCGTRVTAHIVECPPGTYRVICDVPNSVRVEFPASAGQGDLLDFASAVNRERLGVRAETTANLLRIIDAERTTFAALDNDLPGV